MTEKLYYSDGYLYDFDAVITDITTFNNKPALVLDRTAFFPEGGGQPGDTGTIIDKIVADTQIDNGKIYHILHDASGLNVGQPVHGHVDPDVRFARMQAHTGEHIVSGIAHRLFGVNNVGFHMDGTVMTVDFDRYLTKEQLSQVERHANACVYQNVSVCAWYPDADVLETLDFRSKSDDLTDIRIVTIDGYDDCACCAVHVSKTGEIGLIKILTSVSHRGGVRITLVCGVTAYRDYRIKHEQTLHIADLLAAKHEEIGLAVEKQLQKEKDLRWQLQQRTESMIRYVRDNAVPTPGNGVFLFENLNPEELKTGAVLLKDVCGGLCVVISGDNCKGYYFALSSSSVNVKDFTKLIFSALNGSGGGRYEVMQGRFNASYDQIKSFFDRFTVN